MPQYQVPFQVSFELTKILPVHAIAGAAVNATTNLMNYARNLRKSGSDIVVEEDLANLFGYMKVKKSMEDDFKKAVAPISGHTPIIDDRSEVELQLGTGPTMLRAFDKNEHKFFATFILLSLLSFYTGRESLAQAISATIRKRLEVRGDDETRDPGYEGIMRTIRSCNTQSSAFDWGRYVQRVEQNFELFIPNYQHSQDYFRLTPTIFLGAVNFFHATQDLPDRKVSFSNQMGCIVLIIWAHFIMGLSVKVTGQQFQPILFGTPDDIRIIINWSPEPAYGSNDTDEFYWNTGSLKEDTVVRLHDADAAMSVILECVPEQDEKLKIEVEERHPLEGYGTTYLRHILNIGMITDDTNPVYPECLKMVVALAIHASRRMRRIIRFPEGPSDEKIVLTVADDSRPIFLEAWRVMNSADMLFKGMVVDRKGINTYVNTLEQTAFNDEGTLPQNIASRIKRAKGDDALPIAQTSGKDLERQIKHLAKLVLLFAHVNELKDCGSMPLILHGDHTGFDHTIHPICESLESHGEVTAVSAFHSVVELLSLAFTFNISIDFEAPDTNSARQNYYLCSDFGWSVFLNTVRIAKQSDPADVRPELLSIKRGTPFSKKTGEWKCGIRDGVGFLTSDDFSTPIIHRGPTYVPRSIATVEEIKQYWTSRPDFFELTHYINIKPSHEWKQFPKVGNFQEILGYRKMHDMLWHTFTTEPCNHDVDKTDAVQRGSQIEPKVERLGSDVVALIGFCEPAPYDENEGVAERILVYLTKGERLLRWYAVKEAVASRVAYGDYGRSVMLRGKKTCDACALEQVATFTGRWALIL